MPRSLSLKISLPRPNSSSTIPEKEWLTPDGAAWSDLVAFTAITADYADDDPDTGTAERVTVTGTVERYLAVAHDFTGTPSGSEDATYWNGFVRY